MRRLILHIIMTTMFIGTASGQAADTDDLVWPSPPEQERIRYVGTIASDADVAGEPSWLEKIWNVIVGADAEYQGLVQPVSAAVDDDGRLYVTDPGARCIHMFDRENEEYERIAETVSGQLVSPVSVAIAENGMMYVSDSELRSVIVYDEDGDAEWEITEQFERPTGLCISGDTLYVVDTGANAVLSFTLDGTLLRQFGTRGTAPGQFNFPVFCAVRERLYVVDAMNFRVQTFDGAGGFLTSFGKQGTSIGEFSSPKGIAFDSDGNIYVADAMFDAFQIFDGNGTLLLIVGGTGSRHGQFLTPTGIAIDGNDRIYVVDALNKRVEVFQYMKGE
jgi:DNA-binding beta-propeller fold protein YncE